MVSLPAFLENEKLCAHSKAVSLEIPLDVILNAADWKNAGTFAKFYQRETSSVGQFAQAVLTR